MTILNYINSFFSIKKIKRLKLFIWITFYSGIICGCFCSLPYDILDNLFSKQHNLWNLNTFSAIFFGEFSILSLIFMMSFTIFGTIFSFFSVFTKGMGIGLIVYSLHTKFLTKGLIPIFMIMPGMFISSLAIIYFSEKSVKISNKITKIIIHKTETPLFYKLKSYGKSLTKALLVSYLGTFVRILMLDILTRLIKYPL